MMSPILQRTSEMGGANICPTSRPCSGGRQWAIGLLVWLIVIAGSLAPLRAQDSAGIAQYFAAAIEQTQPKMVKVFGASAGNVEGNATGILVSAEGHIITMQGVYLDGRNVRAILSDGKEYPATVLKRDRQTQLALLKIEASTPDFFSLSSEPVGEQGDWVVALTNAFRVADQDEPVSAMWGIISLRTSIEARLNRRDVAYQGELVLVDCITSNPGAGGGAVILSDGRLVGMVGRIIDSTETNTRLNYAVPSSVLAKFRVGDAVEEIVSNPTSTGEKGDLGIVLFKLGGRSSPAYVDRTKPNSPAARAKLQADDMIVSMGGNKIGNVKQFEAALETLQADQEVILIIKRGTEFLRIPIVPEKRK